VPALAAAAAALDDHEHLDETIALNRAGIERLRAGLAALGVAAPPSAGNFVLADLGRAAAQVDHDLLREGVIVRPVANYGLANHLRISTGTAAQNERVLAAMADVLARAR
jgi:histidinol-phosphate aminotransferase